MWKLLSILRSGYNRASNKFGRWNLAALGFGSRLSIGIFIISSWAMKNIGPSAILSFVIGAVTAMLAGLCHAEFVARVPKAGSAFSYTCTAVGEVAGFMMGWCKTLEGLFGAACVAKGLSVYIDKLSYHVLSVELITYFPLRDSSILSKYFDLAAVLFILIIGMISMCITGKLTMVNNILAVSNFAIILLVIVFGLFKANTENWYVGTYTVPVEYGDGGFAPFGVYGVMKVAAVCFYGFVGFEDEEVLGPTRQIPIILSLLVMLVIPTVLYVSVVIVSILMVPYHKQDGSEAVASAFMTLGWPWVAYLLAPGVITGFLGSVFSNILPVSRLLCTMAREGLAWHLLKCSKNRVPYCAIMFSTIISCFLAGFLEFEYLLLMTCLATLATYTIIAVYIIVLRYKSDYEPIAVTSGSNPILASVVQEPSKYSTYVVYVCLVLFLLSCVVSPLSLDYDVLMHIAHIVASVVAVGVLIVIALQPQVREDLGFKTPLVPLIPGFSIYANIYLMITVDFNAWIRFLIWFIMGIAVYVFSKTIYLKRPDSVSSKHRQRYTLLNKSYGKYKSISKHKKKTARLLVSL